MNKEILRILQLLYLVALFCLPALALGQDNPEDAQSYASQGSDHFELITKMFAMVEKIPSKKLGPSQRGVALSDAGYAVLRADGKVVCFRKSLSREEPLEIAGLSRIKALAGHGYPFYALRKDGKVLKWERECREETTGIYSCVYTKAKEIRGLKNIVSIAEGNGILLAIDAKGALWGLGDDWAGWLTQQPKVERRKRVIEKPLRIPLPNPMAMVSVSSYCCVGLDRQGNVWTWSRPDEENKWFRGLGDIYQAPNGFRATKLRGIPKAKYIANDDNTFVVDKKGNVWSWGYTNQLWDARDFRPVRIEGLSGIVSVNPLGLGTFFKNKQGSWKFLSCGEKETYDYNCNLRVGSLKMKFLCITDHDIWTGIILDAKGNMLVMDRDVEKVKLNK